MNINTPEEKDKAYTTIKAYADQHGMNYRAAIRFHGLDASNPQWFYDRKYREEGAGKFKNARKRREAATTQTQLELKPEPKKRPQLVTLQPEAKKKEVTILIGDPDEIMRLLDRAHGGKR